MTDADLSIDFDSSAIPGAGRDLLLQNSRIQQNECFHAGTMISMADGSEKPIEEIEVGDWVMSFDKQGNKVPGRVSRTMTNQSKIILDFHGTLVTPGHVYYCAGGKFEGRFAPLIDILRDDGVVQHEDGSLIFLPPENALPADDTGVELGGDLI